MTKADLVRPGFFGWGNDGARIELWRVGSWYHWSIQTRGNSFSSSAPELPVEYRRFWKGSLSPLPRAEKVSGTI